MPLQNTDDNGLPFLTRKMLAFQEGKAFAISIETQSSRINDITLRGFTREGPFKYIHTTTADAAITTSIFRLPDMPVFVSVIDQSNSFFTGECVATVKLIIDDVAHATLCTGQVNGTKGIAWPVAQDRDSIPNGGAQNSYTSADPGAGAEVALTVPAGQTWKIIGFRLSLVTSATVANRRPHIVVIKGGGQKYDMFSSIDQVASESKVYTFAQFGDLTSQGNGNDILASIPNGLIVQSGDTIATETLNLQAGDNYGTMIVDLELFFN